MRSHLKPFVAIAALVVAAAAHATTYDAVEGELPSSRWGPAPMVVYGPFSAVDYDTGDFDTTAPQAGRAEPGSASDAAEPRDGAREAEKLQDFLQTIWTAP